MDFIKGNNRDKVAFFSIESLIEENNPVRFVDAIVEHLDITHLGFLIDMIKTESRSTFHFFNFKSAAFKTNVMK